VFITNGPYIATGSLIGRPPSSSSSTHWLILSIGVLVIAAIGAVTIVPSFRHKVVDKVKPQVDEARDNLRDLAKQPGKLIRLFAGTAISQVLFALTLGCSLHAYGTSLSFAMLIVINTVAGFLGGVAPVPGGIGVIEAGLIAGFVAYMSDNPTSEGVADRHPADLVG